MASRRGDKPPLHIRRIPLCFPVLESSRKAGNYGSQVRYMRKRNSHREQGEPREKQDSQDLETQRSQGQDNGGKIQDHLEGLHPLPQKRQGGEGPLVDLIGGARRAPSSPVRATTRAHRPVFSPPSNRLHPRTRTTPHQAAEESRGRVTAPHRSQSIRDDRLQALDVHSSDFDRG